MARYCFYCGRELKPGEKCGCRTAAQYAQAQQKPKDQSKDEQKASKQKTTTGLKSLWRRIIGFFNPSDQPNKTRHQVKTKSAGGPSKRPPFFSRKTGQLIWHQAIGYLLRPIETINRPDPVGNRFLSVILLFLAGLLNGFFLLISAHQPQLKFVLSLNSATASLGSGTASNGFLFIQGFGMALAAVFLLAFVYYLALRFVFRRFVPLISLIVNLNPVFFYGELFMIAAMLVLPGSVFSALFMLVAGFGLSALAQFFVMRRLTSFDDNRTFYLVGLVLLIHTAALAFILNLSLPVLTALLDHSAVI
ncbi:MAG: hypothetical protein KBG64_01205 [Clostridia bacterium]|nr:hypothetical protein [Clostridia bacterium]